MRQIIKIGKEFGSFRHAHPVKMALTDHDGDPNLLVQSGVECFTQTPPWRNFLYRYGLCECGDFGIDWGTDYD